MLTRSVRKLSVRLLLTISSLTLSLQTVAAATITFVSGTNPDVTTLDAWRTSSVAKALDADGNNVYGTDGYFMAGTGLGSVTPGYLQAPGLTLSGGTSTYGGDPQYADIDDPAAPPANLDTGIYYQNNSPAADIVSFTISSSLVGSKSFRLGILADNSGHATLSTVGISPDTFRVHQTVGGAATSATIPGDNQEEVAHWFFFDIVGAVANDQFALEVSSDGGGGFPLVGIGGLTFDSITEAEAVPEPSTLILAALGLAGLGLVAWRKRK